MPVESYHFPELQYNAVLFHSSLHHFKDIENLLGTLVKRTLKPKGKIIINEYVGPNRLQYSRSQIKAINQALQLIDIEYRKIYCTDIYKRKYWAPGLLRMLISDPSECVESENILPVLHKYYWPIEEKPLGGNILMNVLKDISHHFLEWTPEKKKILDALIDFEEEYLLSEASHFLFGVYEKPP